MKGLLQHFLVGFLLVQSLQVTLAGEKVLCYFIVQLYRMSFMTCQKLHSKSISAVGPKRGTLACMAFIVVGRYLLHTWPFLC